MALSCLPLSRSFNPIARTSSCLASVSYPRSSSCAHLHWPVFKAQLTSGQTQTFCPQHCWSVPAKMQQQLLPCHTSLQGCQPTHCQTCRRCCLPKAMCLASDRASSHHRCNYPCHGPHKLYNTMHLGTTTKIWQRQQSWTGSLRAWWACGLRSPSSITHVHPTQCVPSHWVCVWKVQDRVEGEI